MRAVVPSLSGSHYAIALPILGIMVGILAGVGRPGVA